MTPSPIRVLLAEDIDILRMGLTALLASYQDMAIVGEARDGLEAVEQCLRLTPDVVLMDLSMPRKDGPRAIEEIKTLAPRTKVLALTAHMEPALVRRTIASGADGYLLKNVPQEELARAIRLVASGGRFMGEDVRAVLETDG